MNKRIPTVRKLLVGATTIGLTAFMAGVVLAAPAYASITSPANGANLTGNVTFAATGTANTGACALVGDESSTVLELLNSSNGVVDSSSASESYGNESAAATSFTYPTYESPNGTYTVNDQEKYYTGLFCTHDTNTYTETVHIANSSSLTYTGASSGDPGQTVTVSAVLSLSGITTPAGQTVTFALSGGNSVNATTNASGVASTTLTVTGPARSATITASYAAGQYYYYPASSTAPGFTVGQDPTNVSVGATTTTPAYGEADTFTASVNSTLYGNNPNGTPTGSIQFQVNSVNYGSPVSLVGGMANITDPSIGNAGPYTIAAVYSGDSNYSGNTGTLGVTVEAATTSTALVANPISTVYGQSVSFTATVTTQGLGSGTPTGTVTFQVNGSPFGVPVSLNGGQAPSQSIATLGANSYTITAIFNGSTDFAGSSTSITYRVGQAASTTTAVTSATPYAVYGQGITFTATVVDSSPNSTGTPTGSVDFQVEGVSPGTTSQGSYTDIGSGALIGDSASSPTISTLNPGDYSVEAIYSGDTNFTGSTDTISQFVTPDTTTTSLSSSDATSVYGQPVTVTADVAANPPGAGTPTGQVDFQIVNNLPGSTVTDLGDVALSSGSAGISLPTEPAGTYTVTATYEGSPLADFQTSTTTITQTVNPDPTTTTVTSSANPSVYGQSVTFTATVTANGPGSGTPTGTVSFYDGATLLASENLAVTGGNDQASLTTSALSVATHAITATYSGDPNFVTSNDSLTQTVNQDQSTTTVAQNGGSQPGQPVSFTATVNANAPGSGTPTGTVIFELNGAPIGSPAGLSGGQATSETLSNLTPGVYTITAVYSGDTNFLTSTGTSTQPVGLAATTTSLIASPNPATYSQAVTLTATVNVVSPGSGNPTGTVDFYNGPYLLGSALLSGGQASITTSSLPIGSDSLTASYVSDADFLASQSTAVSETVGVIPTSTSLGSAPDPSSYGQAVKLTATVAPQSPYGGTPTGSVTFYDGATPIGTASLSSGSGGDQATLTVSNLPVGSDHLTASYSGDSTYGASSTASADTQTVHQATTTLAAAPLSGSTISATLSTAQGPLAGQTLVFTTGSTTICSATTNAQGVASCTASGLDVLAIDLNHGYTVTYAATTDYTGATASGAS